MALYPGANNTGIDYAASSSINNLDAQTWLIWIRPSTFDSPATGFNRRIAKKNTLDYALGDDSTSGSAPRIAWTRDRATTNSEVRAEDFTTNVWQFVAFTDEDSQLPQMFVGTLSSLAVECSTAYVQTTGSGAPTDDSGAALNIGYRPDSNRNSLADIAYLWVYNRRLSLAEIRQHQFAPWMIMSGCVLHAKYFDDQGASLADWSGNGNTGTLAGSPTVTAHVSIPQPFLPVETATIAVAAAAGGPSPAGIYHHRSQQ